MPGTSRWNARPRRALLLVALLAALLATPPAARAGYVPSVPGKEAVLWAVGDGDAGPASQAVTGMMAGAGMDKFLYLGDVYENGTAQDFADNYDPTFGQLASLTAPTIGNHEWSNVTVGYNPYWNAVYGSNPPQWYALRAGRWQILSLSSEAPHGAGSQQVQWLGKRLARSPEFGDCRLAFWHRPRYTAGTNPFVGETPSVQPFWDALAGKATIVLNGHDHNMQRLAPVNGITELISGAGGHDDDVFPVNELDPRLLFSNDTGFGALRLTLSRNQAQLAFVSAAGQVLDQSSVACARAPTG